MGWRESRDKWLEGRIPPRVPKEDVIYWLAEDDVWNLAEVTWTPGRGSHFGRIYIQCIGQILPKWSGDTFDLNHVNGREVLKWQVEQLVKAYEQLVELKENENETKD